MTNARRRRSRLGLPLTLLALLLVSGCGRRDTPKVLVIGLDGATFDVMDPLIEEGLLPNLAAFQARATSGPLETIMPLISPPAWTSATTGVNPGKHNVFDFFHMSKSRPQPLLTSSLDRRARPVWSVLNEEGFKTGIMNIPMTFPPDGVDGFFISGFPYGNATSGFTYPQELEREIAPYPLDPFGESIEKGNEGKLLSYLRGTFEAHARTALDLLTRKDWDLFWVVFTGTDKVQHFYWKFSDPEHPEHQPELAGEYGSAIRDFFVRVDEVVGQLLEAVGPETDVLIVSDHGFGPIYRELRLSNWLLDEGFVRIDPDDARNNYVEAMAPGPFAGLVRVNQVGRDFGGQIPRGEAAEVRERIRDKLEELVDPETGEKFVERVFAREELYSGPYVENAPDIVFLESRTGFVGRRPGASNEVFGLPSYTFSGFHRPYGILMAAGPHFPARPGRTGFSILDITPSIYWLFDVDLPRDLDGEVPEALVGAEALRARPPRVGNVEVVMQPADALGNYDPEVMKSLGYVR